MLTWWLILIEYLSLVSLIYGQSVGGQTGSPVQNNQTTPYLIHDLNLRLTLTLAEVPPISIRACAPSPYTSCKSGGEGWGASQE